MGRGFFLINTFMTFQEEMEADLLTMFDTSYFGTNITFGSPATTITGIFDQPHIEIDNGLSTFSSTEIYVHVRTSDVGSVVQGTTLTIDGTDHTVADVRPDGTGVTILTLHVAS